MIYVCLRKEDRSFVSKFNWYYGRYRMVHTYVDIMSDRWCAITHTNKPGKALRMNYQNWLFVMAYSQHLSVTNDTYTMIQIP